MRIQSALAALTALGLIATGGCTARTAGDGVAVGMGGDAIANDPLGPGPGDPVAGVGGITPGSVGPGDLGESAAYYYR